MPQDLSNYSNILIELSKAVKMHNFYPDGHPNLDSALERCYSLLKKTVAEEGDIKWTIDQKGFYSDKNPLAAGNADVAALAKKIFFKRVSEVTFTQMLTVKDMKTLFSVLKLEPDELAAKGGAVNVFATEDVMGILLNALTYKDLYKLKKDLEEKRRKEEAAKEEQKKKEAETGDSTKEEKEPPPPDEKKPEKEEDLAELLERIKDQRDIIRYKDLSVRIKERCMTLRADQKLSEVLSALFVFVYHTNEIWGMPEEIQQIAAEALTDYLNDEMIQYLIGRIGVKDEPARIDIQRILVSGGEPAIKRLLDAVIAAPEAASRRHYYNTLLLFGPAIRPDVEKRIKDAEWFIIRQMVSLLGDIADVGALDALEDAYRHPDVRVKKEVLKSLVKIPSPRSTAALINALDEKEEALAAQAIISLGMLRDKSSIDALGKIALRRDPFGEPKDTVKEAIKALGNIGDDRCVPYLQEVLFKKVWLGRRANEEARVLAANGLGMIGTKDAYDAVEKTASDSSGGLFNACKRILDGKEKTK